VPTAREATLRHADPDRDAAACAAIYAPYVAEGAASFEEVVLDAEQFAERIATTTRTHPWLVLEDGDGRVFAYAYAGAHRARAAYRWTTEVGIYVDAAHHRSGAGRRLYGALLELLRRQNMRVALAAVTVPNEASIGLHRAMGFEEVGTFRDVGWKAGAWRDVAWLQLDLDGSGPPAEPLGPQRLPDSP
jgi:L-amino acid N-acyltransferase YncA